MTLQYILQESTTATGPFTDVPGSPFTTLTDTITGLSAGATLFFRIQAQDTLFNVLGPATVVGPFTLGVTTPVESPQGTRLTDTNGSIVDASLATWRLVSVASPVGALTVGTVTTTTVVLSWTAPPASQLQIRHPDGTQDGANVTVLLYWNHKVFRNDAAGWAQWTGTVWQSVPGDPSQPVQGPVESSQGTIVVDTTATITDASGGTWKFVGQPGNTGVGTFATPGNGSITFQGNIWTIDPSGAILVNGGILDGGSGTGAIDLFNNTMYGQDAATGQWFTWDGTTFNPSNAPGNLPTGGPSNVFQVAHNGVTDTTQLNLTLMLYWNHQVYIQNATGGWFSWNGSAWVSTTDPRQSTQSQTPDGTVVSNTTDKIVDSGLHVFTLVDSSAQGLGLQIARDGVTDSTTQQVVFLLYWHGTVYHTSTNGNALGTPGWWSYSNGWVPVNGDPRGQIVTWSTTDKTGSIVLSNGNLSARTIGAGSQGIRSSLGRSSGKVFFEVTMTTGTADFGCGIATSAFNLQAPLQLGGDPTGVGFYPVSPPLAIYTGGNSPASQGTGSDVNGAVISCAVDLDAKLIWFSSPKMRSNGFTWNNTTANPRLGTGGISFSIGDGPYFVAFNDDLGGATATANFGATPFNQSIPQGFAAWATGTATPIDPNGATFDDQFTGAFSLYNTRNPTAGGTWQPGFWYAADGQVQDDSWVLNPFNPATNIPGVYTVSGGQAKLQLINTPTGFASACGGQSYVGSTIHTSPSFSQLHGYFEARFASSAIIGCYPDFFLMNNQTWPPEIDVIEIVNVGSWIGKITVWQMDGTILPGGERYTYDPQSNLTNFDPSVMHSYAVDWQPDFMTFYWDRVQVLQVPTPAGYSTPMFPILQIDAGDGSFGGPINNPNLLPATLQIDYVTVWKTRPF